MLMDDSIYIVDTGINKLVQVTPCSYSKLGFSERRDLEEWIKKNPEVLCEELLIITSEFDKFDRSSLRLDLLAIDKNGTLVVI